MSLTYPKIANYFFETCEKIKVGTFHITDPYGKVHQFGSGQPEADIHIRDWGVLTSLAARGDIGLGETYIAGLWDSTSIENIVKVAFLNRDIFDSEINGSFLNKFILVFMDRFLRRNNRKGSRKNIQAHYDVSNDFYKLWLDDTMTYSSALYSDKTDNLVDAQNKKYDRLLNTIKNCGENILEIGCGWGGFAERAAKEGRHVTGLTISQAQLEYAQNRLGNQADIVLRDYREVKGKFDAIVSIEMIEAVGERYWPKYFSAIKSSLADYGRASIQAIIVEDDHFPDYRKRSDFIRHYTFPGGMLISPGKINELAKGSGLEAENLFRFGQDYARTLREWLGRFHSAKEDIFKLGFTESFFRSWQFYLEICAASFAVSRTDVIHIELRHT